MSPKVGTQPEAHGLVPDSSANHSSANHLKTGTARQLETTVTVTGSEPAGPKSHGGNRGLSQAASGLCGRCGGPSSLARAAAGSVRLERKKLESASLSTHHPSHGHDAHACNNLKTGTDSRSRAGARAQARNQSSSS
eukprot:3596461-Rhodomonas_salina.1